jgi:TonB-dependent Receptor Plug Domain
MIRSIMPKGGAVFGAAVLALCIAQLAYGQSVSDQSQSNDQKKPTPTDQEVSQEQAGEKDVHELSPFLVESTTDDNSYRANSTLAGTRVRTDLNDVASAISVVTSQFLKDTGVNNNQELLVYTPSTEVSGIGGNYSGYAGAKSYNESLINPGNTNRVRGLDAADNTRDYFLTDIPWDSYNTGRIDLQRGPNSILFGVGSPAGIINASMNDAGYKNSFKVENVVDRWGSIRISSDINQVVIPGELAVRIAALNDDELYEQKYAYNNQKRLYLATRFDKELLGKGNKTTFRVKYERGQVSSNNPRTLPPIDQITPWFNSTYNKIVWNEDVAGQGYLSTTSLGYTLLRPGGSAGLEGATSGPDVKSFYVAGNSAPQLIMTGNINTGPGMLVQALRPMQMPTYSQWASANLPGGSFYTNKVLTDPSIFDYFTSLLDGPNKHEWQNWTALNADLQQTFFHDRLAFDFSYDHQKFIDGQTELMGGGYYSIGVELNQVLPDGSTNPFIGRPYVAGNSAGGNYAYSTLRESKRAIVTADLNSADLLHKGLLTEILGHHVLTAISDEDERTYTMATWAQNATTEDLINLYSLQSSSLNSIAGNRQFDWIYYLGGSMLNLNSPSNLNLAPVSITLAPGTQSVVKYFNGAWTAPSTVNRTDPYTYTDLNTGKSVTGTAQDNPANYAGWQSGSVSWLNATNPSDFSSLVIGGDKQDYKDISQGFTWQGYMFGGDLIPTFGWRRDKVVNYDTTAQTNQATGIAPLQYSLDPAGRRDTDGESRNWSGVYHIPKTLTDKLWKGLSVSVFYDKSSNFKADAPRRNLMGNVIPNPQGNTREKGISIGLFDDKLIFKVDQFHTLDANATLATGSTAILGNNSYELYQITALAYAEAAMVQDNLQGVPDGGVTAAALPTWVNYAYNDAVPGVTQYDTLKNTTASSPFQTAPQTIAEEKMVTAWLNMPSFITSDFYHFWNVPGAGIDPSKARASGWLHDAFGGTNSYTDFLYLVSILSPSASTLPVSTVNTLSKGEEYELTFVPMHNWNITLNYSHVFATRTNLDASTVQYMTLLNNFFGGDAGYLRLWALPSYQISNLWHKDLWLPYQVTLSSQGQSAPEVSPWRLNAISSYTIDRGSLKGVMFGGALRMEAARISGYKYSSTLGYLDVGQPIMGPQDTHLDLWLGYSRKLAFHNLLWHVQLNMRNVGESTRLVPSYYEPDGSLALARIQEGMGFRLTNSIEF